MEIKLNKNEVKLECKIRRNNVIYSLFKSNIGNFKGLDSGFNQDDWALDKGIIESSFRNALNHFGQNIDIEDIYIISDEYHDDYGTLYNCYWITEYSMVLIDQLNPFDYSTILIHLEENIGINEDLTQRNLIKGENYHKHITECLENFAESGHYLPN